MNFPIKNLKEQAPNLKWIHVISAGVEHLLPLDWMSDDLVLTNSSGAHAKKAGEFGLMSILMLQNHMTRLITHQKNKEFVSLFSNPIIGKTIAGPPSPIPLCMSYKLPLPNHQIGKQFPHQ